MGKIIDLNQRFQGKEEYKAQLEIVRSTFRDIAEDVEQLCVDLAMAGAWTEWNKKQPIGAEEDISIEALMDTGDENCSRIMNIYKSIIKTIDQLC